MSMCCANIIKTDSGKAVTAHMILPTTVSPIFGKTIEGNPEVT